MSNLAPIVLFVYNRLDHTKQTLEALQKNHLAKESEVFIYSDAAKNPDIKQAVDEVREYLKTIDGFKQVSIVEREQNWGLAKSIIDGVTTVVNEYGKIIVLEDDLLTSPYFLMFMNEALNFYKENHTILSISGFSPNKKFMNFPHNYTNDIYIHIRPMSWGWGTWKERWNTVDWKVEQYKSFIVNPFKIIQFNKGGTDLSNMLKVQMAGKIDSWYIRWAFHAYTMKQNTIYPVESFVENIGYDNTGMHCEVDDQHVFTHDSLSRKELWEFQKNIQMNKSIVNHYNKAFNLSYWNRSKWFVKNILWYLRVLK